MQSYLLTGSQVKEYLMVLLHFFAVFTSIQLYGTDPAHSFKTIRF